MKKQSSLICKILQSMKLIKKKKLKEKPQFFLCWLRSFFIALRFILRSVSKLEKHTYVYTFIILRIHIYYFVKLNFRRFTHNSIQESFKPCNKEKSVWPVITVLEVMRKKLLPPGLYMIEYTVTEETKRKSSS